MNTLEHNRRKVAILATNGFEESELFEPKKALEDAKVDFEIVSLNKGTIKGWKGENWGKSIAVDKTVRETSQRDYTALMLPGGVANPDLLRRDDEAVTFVRSFFENHKPVAAICHAPQVLIEAGVVKDRKMTSFSSIKTDLKNAGANWVDEEVVVDEGLVTSRSPDDLKAFNEKLIEEVMEGKHEDQEA